MRLVGPPPPLLLLLLLLAEPPGARAAGTALPETESTTDTEATTTESTTESTTERTTESTTERPTESTSAAARANGTARANGSAGAPPPPPPSRSPRPPRPSAPSGPGRTNGTTAAGSGETAAAPNGTNGAGGGTKATTAVLAGGSAGGPSKAAAPGPPGPPPPLLLLRRVPLAFRVLNRNFSERLLDPASPEYARLARSVLAVLDSVFACSGCATRQAYKGCSSLRFSQGSVLVASELVFERDASVSGAGAEEQLRERLDPSGFIMGLQLSDIQSAGDWSGTEPAVPPWAIALLVLVSVLVLLTLLMCCLMTTCSCRRKSRGKLDLFSAKDSYHPAAEYPPHQSHGRYAAPGAKHSPYSQVAGGAGAGTFTYTNPAAGTDKP